MSKKIVLDDGKYTIVYDKNNQYPIKCLRYGEEWRDLLGDNLIFWLCASIEELEDERGENYENFKTRQNKKIHF
jgi:hypothetical protein